MMDDFERDEEGRLLLLVGRSDWSFDESKPPLRGTHLHHIRRWGWAWALPVTGLPEVVEALRTRWGPVAGASLSILRISRGIGLETPPETYLVLVLGDRYRPPTDRYVGDLSSGEEVE